MSLPRILPAAFALLLLAPHIRADPDPAAGAISLRVGRPLDFNPGFRVMFTICDDTSLVRVEWSGQPGVPRLTGLKPGATLCGFYQARGRAALSTVYRVTIAL
jgi:hypothetical protein